MLFLCNFVISFFLGQTVDFLISNYLNEQWPDCFIYYRADAQKLQQKQEKQEESGAVAASTVRSVTALADQDQRKALKFGFSAKGGPSKVFMVLNVNITFFFLVQLIIEIPEQSPRETLL